MSRLTLHIQIIIWILTFYFQHGCARRLLCKVGTQHEEYNSDVQICCDGQIGQRVRDQECCGGKTFYSSSLFICCDGKVKERYIPPKGSHLRDCSINDEQCREQTCCGGKVVDKDDTMCCLHHTIKLNHTQQLEKDFLLCCDKNILNINTHFCCENMRQSRGMGLECCGGILYDVRSEKCLTSYRPHRVVNNYNNYCGDKEYDMRDNGCCSETLQTVPELDPENPMNRNPKFSCCDHIVYDKAQMKCCREQHTNFPTHTILNEPNIYCCGHGSYNATHQDCFNGKLLEKVPGKERCGYEYIDGNTTKCCDNTPYDSENEKCCKGDEVNVISKNLECCNGVGINETMLCCNYIAPYPKSRQDDDECCYNYKTKSGKTYSSNKNEHCVEGVVIKVPRGAKVCGDNNFYSPKTEICCGGKISKMSSGFDECCNEKLYKSKSQQCCNSEISMIPPTEGSCCIKDFKVYKYEDTRNPCRHRCGNETYDDTRQLCCQGVLHDLDGDSECCGTSAISSYEQGCCAGMFPWARNGNVRCCGNRDLYNKKYAKCINNKITLRDTNLAKLSDVQHLCSNLALKYFDGGVRYMCETQYIFEGRLAKVQVLNNFLSNATYISLSFSDVTSLKREGFLNHWMAPENLKLVLEVPNNENIKCDKKYFNKFCKVIVFFNGIVAGKNVHISKNSKFFMTSYTRKREVVVTKRLSYEFCTKNFSVLLF